MIKAIIQTSPHFRKDEVEIDAVHVNDDKPGSR